MQYKIINDAYGNVGSIELTKEDNTKISIPLDPANTDYQEYLEWVAEGNEPEPADEPAPE